MADTASLDVVVNRNVRVRPETWSAFVTATGQRTIRECLEEALAQWLVAQREETEA